MKYPVQISWRNVPKIKKIKSLIHEKAKKLDQINDDLISCRVILEKPQKNLKAGRIYQVRVEITVPPETVISVQKDAGKGDKNERLEQIIRNTFQSVWRQLREHTRKRRGNVKYHPMQESSAVVARLFSENGYGFIKTDHGREVYFHENSVLNNGFNRMSPGMGVRFEEEMGEKGPQASSVRIIDHVQ